jgi:hypothetical protein
LLSKKLRRFRKAVGCRRAMSNEHSGVGGEALAAV